MVKCIVLPPPMSGLSSKTDRLPPAAAPCLHLLSSVSDRGTMALSGQGTAMTAHILGARGFCFCGYPRVRIQGAPQPKGTAVPPPHDPRFSSPIDTSVSGRPEQAKSIIIRAGGHGSIRRLLDFSQFLRKAPATQNVPEFSVFC